MILRGLATLVLLALLGIALLLPSQPQFARGPENRVRTDIETGIEVGARLPDFALVGLDGKEWTQDELVGEPLLLTFERSLDWCAATKARVLGLRDAFAASPEPRIVWVMSDTQVSARARAFIAELGLSERILFLADPKSNLIRRLGLLLPNPDWIEVGVPHPTTLLLDRDGRVRFLDVRENFEFWLDPRALATAMAGIE